LDSQSIDDVLNGEPYKILISTHKKERIDDIPYCKDCDQLYHVPESSIWTNIKKRNYYQSFGEIIRDYTN
jgi:hypothetical protein